MKKNLKRNFKRWIAFVLAVVIIMTTCVYSSDAYLRATGDGQGETEPTVSEQTISPTSEEGDGSGNDDAGDEGASFGEEGDGSGDEGAGSGEEGDGSGDEDAGFGAEGDGTGGDDSGAEGDNSGEDGSGDDASGVLEEDDGSGEGTEEVNQGIENTEDVPDSASADDAPELNGDDISDDGDDEEEVYKITFYYVDPSNEGAERVELASQDVESGKAIEALPDAPDVDGFEFTGWQSGGSTVITGMVPESDMDVYASYNALKGTFSITINYVYEDGSMAAPSFTATAMVGDTFEKTVTSPLISGFTPDKDEVEISATEDFTETVKYRGGTISYKIIHMVEGLDGTFSQESEEAKEGYIGKMTEAEAKEMEGFTAGVVNNYVIASEGNNDIEIQYIRNNYTIHFNTDGGSYAKPFTYKYGAEIQYPEVTKNGYEFAGWKLEEGGEVPVDMPARDITVKATWEDAKTAEYKVVYWREKVPGTYEGETQYDFEDSYVVKGATVGNSAEYERKSYKGFELDATKTNAEDVIVTADGKAVKHVYYNRETYTIRFMQKSWGTWRENESLRITAKYGEDISKQWEKACENAAWGPTKDTYPQYTLFANMPAENLTMYKKNPSGSYKYVIYYVQGLDGKYKEYSRYSVGNVSLSKEDRQPIEGFEWAYNDGLNLYYNRLEFELSFENCVADTVKVKYEDNISKYLPSNPVPDKDTDNDYVFDGWYYSPAYTNKVEDGRTMPAYNLRIYAKWKKPTYTVTFSTEQGTAPAPITVEKYETISDKLKDLDDTEEYTFTGWYTDSDCRHPYVPSTQITEDMTLYAGWLKTSGTYSYVVKYVDENGNPIGLQQTEKSGNVGETVTETAPQITGYVATVTSKSLNLNRDGQEIVFTYKKVETWSYKVRYLNEKGEDIAAQKEVTTSDLTVVENFIAISGYTIDGAKQQTLTKESEKHEIIFRYKPHIKAQYVIKHMQENLDGSYVEVVEDKVTGEGVKGQTVTAQPKSYEGFTSPKAKRVTLSGMSETQVIELWYTRVMKGYTVHYLEKSSNGDIGGAVAPDKTTGTAKYGEQVTSISEKISIEGYEYAGAKEGGITISLNEAENVITLYYTKRADLSYTVNYLEKDKNTVLHTPKTEKSQIFGTMITSADEVIEIDGYKYDSVDKETLTIGTGENIINIYYTKKADLSYKVNYLEKDTNKVLSTQKVVNNQTFEDVIESKNEVISIDGYNYDSVDKETLTIGTGENVINIYYTKKTDLSYKVNYLEKDTNKVLSTQKVEGNQTFEDVIESKNEVISIDGYNYDRADKETLTIGTGENVINLYYTKRADLSYIVNYLEETTNKPLQTQKVAKNQTFESKIVIANEIIDIDGYNYSSHTPDNEDGKLQIQTYENETDNPNVINIYYTKKTNLSYTVKYLEKDNTDNVLKEPDTVNGQTFGDKIVGSRIQVSIDGYNYDSSSPDELEIKDNTKDGVTNEITLYYTKKNDLSYTVTHREEGTETILEGPTRVEEQEFGTVINPADIVANIDGYNYSRADKESLTIEDEEGPNEITLYYTKRIDLSYTVNYHYYSGDDGNTPDGTNTVQPEEGASVEFNSSIPYNVAENENYNGKHYVIDTRKGNGSGVVLGASNGLVSTTETNNTVDVYYVLDNNGPKGKDDTIPDYLQHRVYYDLNGGTGTVEDLNIYEEGYTVSVVAAEPSKTNAKFSGWKRQDTNDMVGADGFSMPDKDVTLIAQWKSVAISKDFTHKIVADEDGEFKHNLGEPIDFQILVTNNGDVVLERVEVSDNLAGAEIKDGDGYAVENGKAVITQMKPRTAVTVNASYEVKEPDIENAQKGMSLVNMATAKGDDAPEMTADVTVPIKGDKIALLVEKTINEEESTKTGKDGKFTTGDTVVFDVTVTNTGNRTLKSITLTDELTDAVFTKGNLIERLLEFNANGNQLVIKNLEPGPDKAETFKVSYEIQEDDLKKTDFKNIITADVEGTEPAESEIIETETQSPEFAVSKVIDRITRPGTDDLVSSDKVKVGDVIHYVITVKNTGNMALKDIEVTDNLKAEGKVTFGKAVNSKGEDVSVDINENVAKVVELPIGETVTLNCSYEVSREDAGEAGLDAEGNNIPADNTITNTVSVTGKTEKPENPQPKDEETPPTDPVTVEDIYTLTIRYLYASGAEAATEYSMKYLAGERVERIDSPAIAGYRPDIAFFVFETGVMPERNITIDVVYTAIPAVEPTPEPTVTPEPSATPGGGDPEPEPEEDTPVPTAPPTVPEVPPVEDGPEAPVAPVVPGAPAGAAAATLPAGAAGLVAVGDEDVPLGVEAVVDDDGNVTFIPITEDEIPLDNRELDDHKCCILSFLLMLATLIIYSWFTHSMKKRQKKLAELKDQLAEETLKRQLGIADTKESAR